jgi:two-component system sensor histidine kinase KdpD
MNDTEYTRPSPEALLKLAQSEEKNRGKLKIFFGAAPGVGKTYAMLLDAHERVKEGYKLIAGIVETHNRVETETLLKGLEIAPPLMIDYKGMKLEEFNLAYVVLTRPQIVLIDELAHTNAPTCKYEKRHQDVEELLKIGIDVYTTMNVQHLETLNDIIYQITNVRMKETVPDYILELADEIKLIDLPPEELLKRLKEGKVYMGSLAGDAGNKFFRPGNLLALRQLALRVVASRVDEKMRDYMQAHAITCPWPAKERVLACVFASPYAEKLIRSAYRLANNIDADLIAIYIETEKHNKLTEVEVKWLNNAIDLGRVLGAKIEWKSGDDAAQALSEYAKNNNVTKIVIGKPLKFSLRGNIVQRLLSKTRDIDIYLIDPRVGKFKKPKKQEKIFIFKGYTKSFFTVLVMAFVAFFSKHILNETNILFFMLVPVILSALYFGRGPSIFAAILSILLFTYIFIPPAFTFGVLDLQYFFSFIIYVVVALTIGNLASRLRYKIKLLKKSDEKSELLYGVSRELMMAQNIEQILSILVRYITEMFNSEVAICLPSGGKLEVKAKTLEFEVTEKRLATASWVWANKKPAGFGTKILQMSKATFFPIIESDEILGVLALELKNNVETAIMDKLSLVESLANLVAAALKRLKV